MLLVRADRHRSALESGVLEELADIFEVVRIAGIENRNLHAVETLGFQLFDYGEVIAGDVAGPEEKVKSDFHRGRP